MHDMCRGNGSKGTEGTDNTAHQRHAQLRVAAEPQSGRHHDCQPRGLHTPCGNGETGARKVPGTAVIGQRRLLARLTLL